MPPIVVAIVSFWVIFFVLKVSFPFVAPFMFGLILALVLDVPVSYLEAKGWSRTFTSLLFVVLASLALPGVLVFFLVRLWHEIQGLLDLGLLEQLSGELPKNILQFLEEIPLTPGSWPQTLLQWIWAIPDFLLVWTLIACSAYFFCRDKKTLVRFLVSQMPKKSGVSVRKLYHDTSGAFWHLVRVQLLLMLISSTISMVFFCVLELPYPLLSGFLVGFFDLTPILGPGLVYLVLALIQLVSGNTGLAIALGIGYLILLLLRQWGEPHLVSDRLGLHPLVALMGLYAGLRFWGPIGAMVGPVLMVLIKAFMRSQNMVF